MDENIIEIVDNIVAEKGRSPNTAIPVLQAIQDKFNYLPETALKRVCETTDITPSQITGISTFYSQFRHKPVGKHIIKVCVGTACHVKGALQVYDSFKRQLKLKDHEDTDSEGIYTIEKVACLGCCTIAPVVQIDDITYGHVETEKVPEILGDFQLAINNPKPTNIKAFSKGDGSQGEIRIGLGSCCVASGSADVKNELEKTLSKNKIAVDIKHVGCVGVCNQVPMLEIHKPNEQTVFYTKIKADEEKEIIQNHYKANSFFDRFKNTVYDFFDDFVTSELPETIKKYASDKRESPISEFLDGQVYIATEHRGVLKPSDFDEYSRLDGFKALKKCLQGTTPTEIIDIINKSGLKGRGGAGFPSGVKWQMVKDAQSDKKYVICNGDEGDPGAFMDRMLLESYPFRIIEGLIIAGYAVGANEGIFYIRAEYPLAVTRIKDAIKTCEEQLLLGDKILNSDFSFKLSVFEGAGAFVCGEETALIASVEGKRGMPSMRPPYPAEKGLWNKPTLINNTETLALVPWIIRQGADQFNKIGTKNSKGTKVFALAGKIKRGGLIEVPMGISIRQIIENIGGGVPEGRKFKAVQIGGPSGGCIPASMSDTSIDYESLISVGAMMGSGGLIVLDDTDCMVDIAKYFLSFTQDQSCGKCTFCRVGTKRMLQILEKITTGKGTENDLEVLEQLAYSTQKGSICGLGKTAPNPVLSTLKYFRHEYEAHINGQCPTGKCEGLITYNITDDCIGCTICAQKCPVDAIEFKPHELHHIDTEACIKCDVCKQVCPVDAVITI
ncbi:MAG: proton-conducting membrane transporter [Bacteroidetes bacterium]|nr:MAG: proton-conducting membrane transporter [Bacteroidota bacterium]